MSVDRHSETIGCHEFSISDEVVDGVLQECDDREGFAIGNLGFAFPFTVTVVADNVEQRFAVAQPGRASFRVALPAKTCVCVLLGELRQWDGSPVPTESSTICAQAAPQ